jgi:hypothetical protein
MRQNASEGFRAESQTGLAVPAMHVGLIGGINTNAYISSKPLSRTDSSGLSDSPIKPGCTCKLIDKGYNPGRRPMQVPEGLRERGLAQFQAHLKIQVAD